MSRNSDTDDSSTATLALTACGPAVRVTEHDTDDLAVTEQQDVTLDVECAFDADRLATLGNVHKQGAVLLPNDAGEHVAEQCSDADATYRISGDWELELCGNVDDWIGVAVRAAKRQRQAASNARVVTTACHILDSLAEFGDDRPLLAILDLIDHYDVGDFEREAVVERYRDAETPSVEEVSADA